MTQSVQDVGFARLREKLNNAIGDAVALDLPRDKIRLHVDQALDNHNLFRNPYERLAHAIENAARVLGFAILNHNRHDQGPVATTDAVRWFDAVSR